MTSEADNQLQRLLSFSRRMENRGCKPEDLPKLSRECVGKLLVAIRDNFHCDDADDAYWQRFAEKCSDANMHGKPLDPFDCDDFLRYELDYIMRHKRMQSIDVLELLFRTRGMREDLAMDIKKALESSEYQVDDSRDPISIEWSALYANTEAGQRAIVAVRNAGLTEAVKHLQEIEKKIGARDYRGSIMECNLVLEAIMKVIDPSLEEKSLGDCLKSPKIEKTLDHKVLRVALSQINGLLNEARHASGSEKRDYDKNIAVLVCGLTASFAEYLANKYLESKKT